LFSVSSDIGSLRQASRTSRSALARSPRASIALASVKRPLADTGDSFSNHDHATESSRLSSHIAASSRRRRKVCDGQLGLAERKAR
jgi:hypothetical protein